MSGLRESLVASVARLYPFYSGCGSFANSRVVQWLAGVNQTSVWCRTPGGELLAPLDDYIGRAAFYVGDLDRKITWICGQIVQAGDTVLDVGANLGLVTLWMSHLTGPDGCVHAFEPQPALQTLLQQTLKRNRVTNVSLHGMALGNEERQMELRIPAANAGRASLVRELDEANCIRISVPVQTLDRFIQEQNLRSIRLVKIDVEGFEEQVLQGSRKLLQSIRPEAIVFELNDPGAADARDQPVFRLLQEHDYGFFSIPRCLVRMRLQTFEPSRCDQLPGHDFLAVPLGECYQRTAKLMRVRSPRPICVRLGQVIYSKTYSKIEPGGRPLGRRPFGR